MRLCFIGKKAHRLEMGHMERRKFTAILGGAVAWSMAARAQQRGKMDRIGILRIGALPPSFIEPFRRALNEKGRVEGKDYIIDFGIAERVDQLPGIAADLVRRGVNVLVASGTPAVLPARDATSTIPVVIVAAVDPIATGLVTSLARPSGNVTGLTAVFADLTGKRLELLKEMLPTLTRVALVSRPANPGHGQYIQQTKLAARLLGVELEVLSLSNPDEFEIAFRDARGIGALIQIDDAMFTSHRQELVDLANRYRIPGSYGFREFVDIGGFMALGPSYSDLYRRAALVVDKILKGAKPADLPVEQANKFEMIVNLKTAKALGLTISPIFLARVDEVIE
jgi:putative ABC transport system substrate-binding protein